MLLKESSGFYPGEITTFAAKLALPVLERISTKLSDRFFSHTEVHES